MLDYDKKQIMIWRRWLGPALIFSLLLILERFDIIRDIYSGERIFEEGSTINMILDGLKSDSVMLVLPIICTFPYASAMADELRSGMVKQVVTRVSHKQYVSSKAVACILSGVIVTVAAITEFGILHILLLYPLETKVEQPVPDQDWLPLLAGIVCRFSCFGALGSLTGLFMSLLTMNRLMAWIGPFMMDYLLIILYERYLDGIKLFYPKEWLLPAWNWPFGDVGICIWMILLCSILYGMVVVKGKKVMADAL